MPRPQRTLLDSQDAPDLPKGRRSASRVFAFRADPEMVELLSSMPNASEFIRKAISRSIEEPCPICLGSGLVAPGFRKQLERLGGHFVMRRCSCCATEYPGICGETASRLRGSDRLRHELELKRGEFLCAPCLERYPPCGTCGRMLDRHSPEAFVAHFRVQRCGRALLTDPVPDRAPRPAGTPRVPGRYRAR
jgi:hypothetical protein